MATKRLPRKDRKVLLQAILNREVWRGWARAKTKVAQERTQQKESDKWSI